MKDSQQKRFEKKTDRGNRSSSEGDTGRKHNHSHHGHSKSHKGGGKKVFMRPSEDRERVTMLETGSSSGDDIPDTVEDTVPFDSRSRRQREQKPPQIDVVFQPVSTGITLSERFQNLVNT